ncbi:hypothetical protein BYT27DRAFT_7190484 [Phlegmacium glaucopus]|nr:hypothetical protein BYT27DRAFT_7190484 [Phlegmacium glaucopus]
MGLTKDITITIPTLKGIAAGLTEVCRVATATIVEHNIIFGCALILWSFFPKHVFNTISYIVWDIPKNIGLFLVSCLGLVGEDCIGHSSSNANPPPVYNRDHGIPENTSFSVYRGQSYGAIGEPYYYFESDAAREERFSWKFISWVLLIAGILVMVIPEK